MAALGTCVWLGTGPQLQPGDSVGSEAKRAVIIALKRMSNSLCEECFDGRFFGSLLALFTQFLGRSFEGRSAGLLTQQSLRQGVIVGRHFGDRLLLQSTRVLLHFNRLFVLRNHVGDLLRGVVRQIRGSS